LINVTNLATKIALDTKNLGSADSGANTKGLYDAQVITFWTNKNAYDYAVV
jgi:hypothetical protein